MVRLEYARINLEPITFRRKPHGPQQLIEGMPASALRRARRWVTGPVQSSLLQNTRVLVGCAVAAGHTARPRIRKNETTLRIAANRGSIGRSSATVQRSEIAAFNAGYRSSAWK